MLRKILHVDDEDDVRNIAQLALSDIGGFEVCTCDSGRDALAQVQAFGPDLLLVDSMMPDLSGEETVTRIRQLPGCDTIPVVFLTAVGHEDAMKRFRALGPAAIILKPFDPITLHEQLNEVWDSLQSAEPCD